MCQVGVQLCCCGCQVPAEHEQAHAQAALTAECDTIAAGCCCCRCCCLCQVRESLQAKSVEEKRSQLRRVGAQIAAKEAENASVALHLTGEQASSSAAAAPAPLRQAQPHCGPALLGSICCTSVCWASQAAVLSVGSCECGQQAYLVSRLHACVSCTD